MYTVYLFALIGVVIFMWLEFLEGFDWDNIFLVIPSAMAGGVVGVIIACILPAHYTTHKWKVNLVNLQDHSSVSGEFFLGCGQINGEMKYVLYTQEEDSTYRMWQVNYYDAKIKYTNGPPTEDITRVFEEDNLYEKFVLLANLDNYTYIFEVPRGSIKTDFTLDAK